MPNIIISNHLHNAADFFQLGKVVEAEQLVAGLMNLTFLVRTEKGEYILKEFLTGTNEEISLEMTYLTRIRSHGIPAPEYLSGLNGEHIFGQDGHLIVAQQKVEGEVPELTANICRIIGQQLGKLHRIPIEGLPLKEHWLNGNYIATRLTELQGRPIKYVMEAIETYERLKDIDFTQFPQVLIHGDITQDNLLFQDDNLLAILDWEQSGVGAAIMDLAASITGLGLLEREGQVKRALYQALFTGYQSERKLTSVEKQHFQKVIQYMGLIESVWALHKYGIETPDEDKVEGGSFYWYFGMDKLALPALD